MKEKLKVLHIDAQSLEELNLNRVEWRDFIREICNAFEVDRLKCGLRSAVYVLMCTVVKKIMCHLNTYINN